MNKYHELAREKGFWDYTPGTMEHDLLCHDFDRDKVESFLDDWQSEVQNMVIATRLALITSEVSEALEALRTDDPCREKLAEELADIVIRTYDLAGYLSIDLDRMVEEKHQRNAGRSYRHGKAF